MLPLAVPVEGSMLARLSAQSNTKPDASTRRALAVAALIVIWMLARRATRLFAGFSAR